VLRNDVPAAPEMMCPAGHRKEVPMREDKLAERSMEFAVQIIELTKTLRMRKEFIMANQIGRSGTSIGANIREAHYA
jgi:hypothetical protein